MVAQSQRTLAALERRDLPVPELSRAGRGGYVIVFFFAFRCPALLLPFDRQLLSRSAIG